MGTDTEELNTTGLSTTPRDIESTRADLTRDIDELTDKISPQRVVERRKEAVRTSLGSVRDKVMGAASSSSDGPGVTASVKDSTHSAVDGVGSMTQGNPLLTGAIAFGLGMLVSGLLPATDAETRATQQLTDAAKEHAQPLVDHASSVAHEVGDDLKQSAMDSVQEVKSSAQDSADTLKQEGQSSASTVKDQTTS